MDVTNSSAPTFNSIAANWPTPRAMSTMAIATLTTPARPRQRISRPLGGGRRLGRPRHCRARRYVSTAQPPGHQGQIGGRHQQVEGAGWRRTPDQAEQVKAAWNAESLVGRLGWAH